MAAKLAGNTKEKMQPGEGSGEADSVRHAADCLRQAIARIEGRPLTIITDRRHASGNDKNIPPAADRNKKAKTSIPSPSVIEPVRAPLGITPIDDVLDPPGSAGSSQYPSRGSSRGIIINGLHEVRAEVGIAAGTSAGFAMALGLTMTKAMARRLQKQPPNAINGTNADQKALKLPPVFWIADRHTRNEYGGFYGPGLSTFGLEPEDLIRIHPESREESLWAAGEIAATPGAAAFCLIEIRKHPKEMDLTTTRRLLLRAQISHTPVILLRQSGGEEASAALTRWCVHPAASSRQADPALPLPDQFIGPPTFDVSLEKCRGGNANSQTRWTLEWNHDAQCLALASTFPASRAPQQTSHEEGGSGAQIHRLHGSGSQSGDKRQSA